MYFKVHPVVEAGTHTSPALKLAICLKNSKNLNLQIAQISLFQMRYDSLLNSKKWPSDSPKGSATPCFLPTLSVLVFSSLPNHPFSNLDFTGFGQPIS